MGVLPARMVAGDPPWLDRALGVDLVAVARARAFVAWFYAQGIVLPLALAALLRLGWLPALCAAVGLEILALLLALAGAWVARRWPQEGAWIYGPVGMILWGIWLWAVQATPIFGGNT